MIPGRVANALSATLLNNCDKAFNLLSIHSIAPPPFLSTPLLLPDVVVATVGPAIAIPTAVNIDVIVIPCSLRRMNSKIGKAATLKYTKGWCRISMRYDVIQYSKIN